MIAGGRRVRRGSWNGAAFCALGAALLMIGIITVVLVVTLSSSNNNGISTNTGVSTTVSANRFGVQAGKSKSKNSKSKGTEIVDYAIVGQGAGGISVGYFLAQALVDAGQPVSILALEAQDEIGGNAAQTSILEKPAGYDGSFGSELYGDLGPQRITQMTLGMKRRMLHELGLQVAFTPFKGEFQLRGRRLVCGDPTENALSAAAADGLNVNLVPGEAEFVDGGYGFVYGSLCSTDPLFVGSVNNESCAAYPGLHNPSVGNNDDPSSNAYLWLLANAPFASAGNEPDLVNPFYGFDWYSFEGVGGSSPVSGLNCDPDTSSTADCPINFAPGEEWRTHVARQLRFNEPATSVLNYNYSAFMEADNVGFFGDYRNQYGAQSYTDWTLREWGSTNGINGYVPGGERRLMHAMHRNATLNGMRTHLGERVLSVDNHPGNGFAYELQTSTRKIKVRKHLFLNLPPYYLQRGDSTVANAVDVDGEPLVGTWAGSTIGGSTIQALRDVSALKHPYPQGTVRLLAQWAPGEPAWFWPLFSPAGNHSYRAFSDQGCFSRTEFIDTPFHRCTNHMVPVYTDDNCERMWLGYYEALQEGTLTEAEFVQRIVDEMKASFPELAADITPPVHWDFHYFPSAWHWGRVAYDKISNEQVTQAAAAPLGANEPVSLIGEAYATSWSGWMEAAFRTAKRSLTTRFTSNAPLNAAIDSRFEALFEIFRDPTAGNEVSDGSWVSNFAYTPPLYAPQDQCADPNLCLSNEKWWPYYNGIDFNTLTPAQVCSASTYSGFAPITDQ